MKDINKDLLDAPVSPNTKPAVWAKVGAIGVAGIVLSTVIRLYYFNFFTGQMSLTDSLSVPGWVYSLARVSALATLCGVVLTVARKEPKSSFRSIVISLGSVLLLLVVVAIAFAFYMDNMR